MSEATVVGDLRKMRVEEGDPILYTLPVGDESVAVNPLLGETIGIRHTGNIPCIACGRKTGKSFLNNIEAVLAFKTTTTHLGDMS